jgi:hypothetical protein
MENVMLNKNCNWSEEDIKSIIITEYQADPNLVNKFEILIYEGDFDYDTYDESSFMLLRDKETLKLFENHGSHCSCYGFEGQFEPKETTLTYLRSDNFHSYVISKEKIRELIKDL